MRVEPSKPRYTITSEAEVTTVACPPRRNWFVLLFLIAWLGGWTTGGIGAFAQASRPGDHQVFMIFWLLAWALGELYAIAIVLWQLAGLEEVSVTHGSLMHRVSIFGLGRTREFSIKEIKNLRSSPQMSNPWMNQSSWGPPAFGSGNGAIAFDYGAKTYRVGSGLDEAEARQVLQALSKQFPSMVVGTSAT